MDVNIFKDLINASTTILDVGCGTNATGWYAMVPEDKEIIALDLYATPNILRKKFFFCKMDVLDLEKFHSPVKITLHSGGKKVEQ